MIRKVLVPLDGSRSSESVLPTAVKLVTAGNGSLILMHAVIPSEYFSVTAARYVREERRRVTASFDALAARIGEHGFGVEERIVTGEASREIVAEAARSRVDLIAMSSHGRSGIREWAFGSVAERVLRTTSVPVLVFRGNLEKAPAVRKILIPFDGSEDSLQILDPAADLAAVFGSAIVLVHAGSRFPPTLGMAEKLLTAHGRPYEKRLLGGVPADALVKAVRTVGADLLAFATTGRTGRDTFGSVAEQVLKNAGGPLLVVHTGRMD